MQPWGIRIHYYGMFGGIEVYPKARVKFEKTGDTSRIFLLINGTGGKWKSIYGVEVAKMDVTE